MLYNIQPCGIFELQKGSRVKDVDTFASKWLAINKNAEANLKKQQESQKKYYDQYCHDVEFEERYQVLILMKDFKSYGKIHWFLPNC